MHSGIPMSTSSRYQTYPYQQNQNSDMHTPVPPGFAPIQPGFGGNPYENFYVQPQSAMNHAHQRSYPVHQTPNQGFGFHQGQAMDNAPFYRQGFSYQYSVQQQVRSNYSVSGQAQPQQVSRNVQENVLVVELERPIFPMSKPRLRWTPELHGRFTRAAQELGGYFKATPKAILKKMNVRGITRDQLKSHLQKVRNRVLHNSSLNEILNGQAYTMPNFESDIGEHERLHRSCETSDHHQNHRIAPTDEGPVASNFKFEFEEDFDGTTIMQSPNYHRNLRDAMCDDHAEDIKFKDSDFD